MKDPYQKLPKFTYKKIEVRIKEKNIDLDDGQIKIDVERIQQPKPHRYFCLLIQIIYDG